MAIVGLYAGIGGFELGFESAGFKTSLLADRDEHCQTVLSTRFPDAEVVGDVADIEQLPPDTEIVTAGFPCQNLSMAGDKSGLGGSKSGDIRHLFELLEQGDRPTLAIENVYFMLHLDKGAAMAELVSQIEDLDYLWAYRVVNTLSFGLPQRRRRVFLVASKTFDPRQVLFADDAGSPLNHVATLDDPLGFYWTEGRSGVGLAVDGIPPLKVASGIGIPSAPAVLFPDGDVLTPSIEACERLQGFRAGWTDCNFEAKRSPRWSMVGNAVSVPAAKWLAHRISEPGSMLNLSAEELEDGSRWPAAAFGVDKKRYHVDVSEFPLECPPGSISHYRDKHWPALSQRALSGFLSRAREGGLRFPEGFLEALDRALAARAETSRTN